MFWFLSYSATLRFPARNSVSVAEAARQVFYRKLELAKARRITIVGDSLTFTGGFFRIASGMNILGPVGRGRIGIQARDGTVVIQFRVSFIQLIIVSTMLVALMASVIASWGTEGPSWGFYVFLWLWLVGGNIVIFIPRFRGFIRRGMREAMKGDVTK